jgi:hypothetical protein
VQFNIKDDIWVTGGPSGPATVTLSTDYWISWARLVAEPRQEGLVIESALVRSRRRKVGCLPGRGRGWRPDSAVQPGPPGAITGTGTPPGITR